MTRSARRLPALWADWPRIAARLRASRRVVLFLDFDGTLAPTVPLSEYARLSDGTRDVLSRLAHHPQVTVVVISGRRWADVRRRVGVRGIHYLGLYGGEDSRPLRLAPAARVALDRVGGELRRRLRTRAGVSIENKRASLTVHLRDASPRVRRDIRVELRDAVEPYRGRLCLLDNVRDTEILPRGIAGKGDAVRRVLAQPRLRDALAMYFGDDLSDEAGFAAVKGGIAVLVESSRRTAAHYVIGSAAQVTAWLAQLEAVLP
jgi:trehalose-phosphatase